MRILFLFIGEPHQILHALPIAAEMAAAGSDVEVAVASTRHLPVVEQGRMVGFVSIGDLVKYRIDRIEADAAAMRDYIQQA